MNALEKAIRRQYEYYRKRHKNVTNDKILQDVKNWAEEWIVKIDGKLTLTAMREV